MSKAAQIVSSTFPTATRLVRDFEARGWLDELTGFGATRFMSICVTAKRSMSWSARRR